MALTQHKSRKFINFSLKGDEQIKYNTIPLRTCGGSLFHSNKNLEVMSVWKIIALERSNC
jgi:hypothetical protein